MPDVSVLITSYNYARFLSRTIESALGQDGVDLEVIVSDNCSSDESVEVARRYEHDSRFTLVVRETPVLAHYNAISAHARGRYVIYLNADDFLLPGGLRALCELAARSDVDVAYGSFAYVDADGVPYFYQVYEGLGEYAGRNELAALLTRSSHIAMGAIMFERSWLEQAAGFDVASGSHGDLELYLRLAAAGKRFGYTPQPVVAIRKHGANDSDTDSFHNTGRSADGFMYCLEKYCVPENARALRGWDVAISSVARHFMGFLQRLPVWESAGAEMERRLAEVERRLAAIQAAPPETVPHWPRVTVAIVTDGRRPALLRAALASVLAQTYRDFEIVLVADGALPLRPLLADLDPDGRLRFVPQVAAFGTRTRVNAVELGRGEIVAYLEETDLWSTDHLTGAVAAIDAGAGAVRARIRRCVLAYRVVGDGSSAPQPAFEIDAADAALPPGLGASAVWNAVPFSALVHTRRAFDLAGKFDAALPALGDLAFALRLERAVGITELAKSTVTVRTVLDRTIPPWARDWAAFTASLEAIWNAFPVEPAVAAHRATYRARLQDAAAALRTGDDASFRRAALLIEHADDLA